MKKKKKPKPSLGWGEERKTTEQRVGEKKKKKQIWPLKTDCSAVLSWSRCAGIHNSTQGLIQFFSGKKKETWLKTQGQVQTVSSCYSAWGGICCSISIIKVPTRPSLMPARPHFSRWDHRKVDHKKAPAREAEEDAALWTIKCVIHITKCSPLQIPGTRPFVNSVITHRQVTEVSSISHCLQAFSLGR